MSASQRLLKIGTGTIVLAIIICLAVFVPWLDLIPMVGQLIKVEAAISEVYPDYTVDIGTTQRDGREVIRVTVTIPFNPNVDSKAANTLADNIHELALSSADLSQYGDLQVRLMTEKDEGLLDQKQTWIKSFPTKLQD